MKWKWWNSLSKVRQEELLRERAERLERTKYKPSEYLNNDWTNAPSIRHYRNPFK